jgi:hypothetical protein
MDRLHARNDGERLRAQRQFAETASSPNSKLCLFQFTEWPIRRTALLFQRQTRQKTIFSNGKLIEWQTN